MNFSPAFPRPEPSTSRSSALATETQVAVAFERFQWLWRLRDQMQCCAWLELDIPMADLRLLGVLAEIPRIGMRELVRRLGTGVHATNQALDRLVSTGYVSRVNDPADHRGTILELTPLGSEALHASFGLLQPVRRWLEQLAPEDLTAATQGFEALLRVAEATVIAEDAPA